MSARATGPRFARRLIRDRSGVAMLEFAFALPLVLGVSLYAIETASLALANLRVSQVALNLADNAARVGEAQVNNTQQLREIDINDVLAGAYKQSEQWSLTTRGRIILSSLEEKGGKQMIHWQRCLGMKSGAGFDSRYALTDNNDGTSTNSNDAGVEAPGGGMSDGGTKVTAPPASGVMFVEVNYEYQPVVSTRWLPGGSANIRYIASFVVRDQRVFTQIFNPSPAATRYVCNNRYTAT